MKNTATAAQKDRVRRLKEKLDANNVDTLVVPYSYSNQNKQRMMTALQDSLSSGTLIFPKKEYIEKHEVYKELIDELLYLQVKTTGSSTTYKAPEGSSFHDDFTMSLAQLNYLCLYVYNNYNKQIDLGDGMTYRLRFHRNMGSVKTIQQKTNRDKRSRYYKL